MLSLAETVFKDQIYEELVVPLADSLDENDVVEGCFDAVFDGFGVCEGNHVFTVKESGCVDLKIRGAPASGLFIYLNLSFCGVRACLAMVIIMIRRRWETGGP